MKRVVNIVLSVLIGDKFFDMRGRAGLLEFWTVMLVYVLLPLGVMAFVQKNQVIIICSFFSGVFVSLDYVGLNGAQAA